MGKSAFRLALFALLAAACLNGFAQAGEDAPRRDRAPVRASLLILQDTVDLGVPFKARLKLTHPAYLKVWLLDTAEAFRPFEVVKTAKQETLKSGPEVTTQTNYLLRSFAIDSTQRLSIPFAYKSRNSERVGQGASNIDSVTFIPRLPAFPPESYNYKANVEMAEVGAPAFVQWFFYAVALFAIGVILAGVSVLRRPVQRFIRRRKIDKEWRQTRQALLDVQEQEKMQALLIQKVNAIWKRYLEKTYLPLANSPASALAALDSREFDDLMQLLPHLDAASRQTLRELLSAEEDIYFAKKNYPSDEVRRLIIQLLPLLDHERDRRKTYMN